MLYYNISCWIFFAELQNNSGLLIDVVRPSVWHQHFGLPLRLSLEIALRSGHTILSCFLVFKMVRLADKSYNFKSTSYLMIFHLLQKIELLNLLSHIYKVVPESWVDVVPNDLEFQRVTRDIIIISKCHKGHNNFKVSQGT